MAVGRSENPGGHVILGGDNVPPLVEIGLTDPPKSDFIQNICQAPSKCLKQCIKVDKLDYFKNAS